MGAFVSELHRPGLDQDAIIQHDTVAAVSTFNLDEDDLPAGVLRGFAAPADGTRPCALVLAAGSEVIALARADRFSPEARQQELRLGWCGFSIGGVAQGIALGEDIRLCCLLSGRILKRWDGAELAEMVRPSRTLLSVTDLRDRAQAARGCSEIDQVLPFALDLARTRGSRACLNASFRYLLGRPVDSAGAKSFLADFLNVANIVALWSEIMGSPEFRARGRTYLPGPFEPDFPFPLSAIAGVQ